MKKKYSIISILLIGIIALSSCTGTGIKRIRNVFETAIEERFEGYIAFDTFKRYNQTNLEKYLGAFIDEDQIIWKLSDLTPEQMSLPEVIQDEYYSVRDGEYEFLGNLVYKQEGIYPNFGGPDETFEIAWDASGDFNANLGIKFVEGKFNIDFFENFKFRVKFLNITEAEVYGFRPVEDQIIKVVVCSAILLQMSYGNGKTIEYGVEYKDPTAVIGETVEGAIDSVTDSIEDVTDAITDDYDDDYDEDTSESESTETSDDGKTVSGSDLFNAITADAGGNVSYSETLNGLLVTNAPVMVAYKIKVPKNK